MSRLYGLPSLLAAVLLKSRGWRESLSLPPATPHPTSLLLKPHPSPPGALWHSARLFARDILRMLVSQEGEMTISLSDTYNQFHLHRGFQVFLGDGPVLHSCYYFMPSVPHSCLL